MISVVLATHNEEKNLSRCLESVRAFADEIIVVDGESSDDTVKIAKKFKSKLIKTTNKANFHINKQMGMDRARGKLILQLDADEVVDEALKNFILELNNKLEASSYKQILNFKISSSELPVAWWIKRKNLFLGRWLKKGGQYPDPVIRLYINGYAKLPKKDVHEQMKVNGKVSWAKGHLLHYSNPEFKDYMEKFNRYTSFKAQQLETKKVKVNMKNSFLYLIWMPLSTFFSLFIRHKGFIDRVAGFVFALFSGLHHAVAYLKLWEMSRKAG
ncbi:MAG: glycosyltransferase family 2 protein [Patescibacteria group bacterium]